MLLLILLWSLNVISIFVFGWRDYFDLVNDIFFFKLISHVLSQRNFVWIHISFIYRSLTKAKTKFANKNHHLVPWHGSEKMCLFPRTFNNNWTDAHHFLYLYPTQKDLYSNLKSATYTLAWDPGEITLILAP